MPCPPSLPSCASWRSRLSSIVAAPDAAAPPGAAAAPAPEAAAGSDRRAGLHPLLFAAYPVLFLWSQNLGETDPVNVVGPLVVIVAAAAGLTWLLGRVLGDVRRGALIVTPLVVGLLFYGHIASYLTGTPIRPILQQAGWAALVVLGVVGAIRLNAAHIRTLDTALTRIAALLVIITLVLIVPFYAGAATAPTVETTEIGQPQAATSGTGPKRDVYYLVMDRYGSDRSLELRFGATNLLSPWLREHGFTVLDDSHANYVRTAFSMASALNMTHLDAIAAAQGPASHNVSGVHAMLQDSLVARQFKELGYRYYHIGSWWNPGSLDRAADVNLNLAGAGDFVDAMYDESAFPVIVRRLGLGIEGTSGRERHFEHNMYALKALDDLRDDPGPKFVLAHILLPHSPYVFDRDGRYIPASEMASRPEAERHQLQLDYTNSRLRAFIEPLLALPEAERPIIILQADEGPWTRPYIADKREYDWNTASPEELEMKFGIMNAWYVPGGVDLGLDPAMTSINTFPVLFNGYFGLDYPMQSDVIRAGSWNRPYDFIDITDRLPSLK